MNTKKIFVTIAVLFLLIPMLCTDMFPGQTGGQAKAREILDKVTAALGGAEKIAAVKNYAIDVTNIRVTETELLRVNALSVIQFPDKSLLKVWARRGEIILAVEGDKGWIRNPPEDWEPLADKDVKIRRTSILREIFYICQNPQLYNIQFQGEKDWYNRKVLDLHFTAPTEFHFFIDPKTYLPAGCSFKEKLPLKPNPVEQEELYYDYKEIDGVKLLHRSVSKVDGQLILEYTVNAAKINMEIGKDYFKGKGNYVHLSVDK